MMMARRAVREAVVRIRPAAERDLDDVAGIERAVFNDPWSRRSFVDLVDARSVIFSVAVDETDAVVGYAVVLVHGPEAELANIAVARLAQQRGIGRQLLDDVMSQAQRHGATEIFLEVRESNAGAIHLYSQTGFKGVGRRARYYARPVEDALLMKARLNPVHTPSADPKAREDGPYRA
jgi:ribosomal-protein-alanine N-acetyltransferase